MRVRTIASMAAIAIGSLLACSSFDSTPSTPSASLPDAGETVAPPVVVADLDAGGSGSTEDAGSCGALYCADFDTDPIFTGWALAVTMNNAIGPGVSPYTAPNAFRSTLSGTKPPSKGLTTACIQRLLPLPDGARKVSFQLDANVAPVNVLVSIAQLRFQSRLFNVLVNQLQQLQVAWFSAIDAAQVVLTVPFSYDVWHLVRLEIDLEAPQTVRVMVDGSTATTSDNVGVVSTAPPTVLNLGLATSFEPKVTSLLIDRVRFAVE